MLRKSLLGILFTLSALALSAQVESKQGELSATSENIAPETLDAGIEPMPFSIDVTNKDAGSFAEDSIRSVSYIPRMVMGRPTLFSMWMPISPWAWGGMWDIHEGLNAQIGAGVMVGFGKHNPFKGASFFSNVSLVYAKALDEHWTLAMGGTLSRFKFFNDNVFAGDIYALANYRFDDHWSASIYASYNHMPRGMGMYDFTTFNENCARIGGEVTYRFNEKFSMSVGLSQEIPVGNNRPWLSKHPIEKNIK